MDVISGAARETAYDLRRHNPAQPEANRVTGLAER